MKGIIEGGPDPLASTESLAKLIDASGEKPVQITFVHGIRAEGPGQARPLIDQLLQHLAPSATANSTTLPPIDLGDVPTATFIGDSGDPTHPGRTLVWQSPVEWEISRPFVERTTITAGQTTIIVDDVNWWTLLFPLKARFILRPEHDLSGNDVEHLRLLTRSDPPFYPWLDAKDVDAILAETPKSGGGAKFNAVLKHQIMNWGIADAVIALGPMRHYLHYAMDQALAPAAQMDDDASYVIVAESLGSFVVLDALAAKRPNVTKALARAAHIYFLANQFALLELARIEDIPHHVGSPAPAADDMGDPLLAAQVTAIPTVSPLSALARLAQGETSTRDAVPMRPKQIIAFSDPSDLLTYRVPAMQGVAVVNLYDRNGGRLFGLANPVKAHTGHAQNPAVWRVLLER